MKFLALATFMALAGCQSVPVDTFCATHTVEDFRPTAAVLAVMTPEQKRATLTTLRDGQRRCGWTQK